MKLSSTTALIAFFLAGPALAGSIEVSVRVHGQNPVAEAPVFLHPPYPPEVPMLERLIRPGAYRGFTDRHGVARFAGLPSGRYTVSLPQIPAELLQPVENPLEPAPVVTLFHDEEELRMDVDLQFGIPVGIAVESNASPEGFLVHYRHRSSGFVRVEPLRSPLPRLRRLLSEGLWEVWITSPPGELLVELEHDGHPLPGSVATLELELPYPPGPMSETTWLTFEYESPATIEGDVIVKGGPLEEIEVVATLVRPGDWLEEAEERGGSTYSPLRVPVGPEGRYRFHLPSGIWHVAPQGRRILVREPEKIFVEAKNDEVNQADFEVELDEEPPRTFRVRVRNRRHEDVEGAVVQLVSREDPTTVLRQGVTQPFGVELDAVEPGDYLIRAGHPEYLETEHELVDFQAAEVSEVFVELSEGAYLELRAVNLEGGPAGRVEWTIEHLGPPLELKLTEPVFVESKTRRLALTDDSGRARVAGLYGGFYRLRAERPAYGDGELGGLFHVGRERSRARPTVELYLPEGRSEEAWARQLPSGTLRFELLCDDNGPLPPDVSVLVVDLDGPVGDIEAAHVPSGGSRGGIQEQAALWREKVALTGRHRNLLAVGPIDQGVYRLALRPAGFTRWTWAFETYVGRESYTIQIDVDENEPATLLDQGTFKLECSPAVDLVPELLEGEMPDMKNVRVRARLLAPDEDVEIASHPQVVRRRDRAELRLLPQGAVRLDFVLSHPHFLPYTDLNWQVELELQRGRYAMVTPQISTLGGALRVVGLTAQPEARLRIEGNGHEATEVVVHGDSVVVPSIVPGRYDVKLCRDPACEPVLHRWPDVDVRPGRTKVITSDP